MNIFPRIKEWWSTNEKIILLFLCFASVFFAGFFTGKITTLQNITPEITIEKTQLHDSIFNENIKLEESSVLGESVDIKTEIEEVGVCKSNQIKGNISSSSKIYHMPGGAFYGRTDAEVCFNTESEAQAAGFRKSSR